MKKKCRKCNKKKDIKEFYVHKQMGDGYLNICKLCVKIRVKEREKRLRKDSEFVEKERERGREKYHRLGYKNNPVDTVSKSQCIKNYNKKYPEKYRAKCLSGTIKCPKGHQKHHWSYKEGDEKDVLIVPIKDHYTFHRVNKYDPKEMKFRDYKGKLMNKKDNEKFFKSLIV